MGKITLLIVLVALLFGAGSIAGYVIEFQWWKEMGQIETWLTMLWYSLAPVAAATACRLCRALDRPCARHEVRRRLAARQSRLRQHRHAGVAGRELFLSPPPPSTPGPSCATSARAACRRKPPPGTTRSSRSRSRSTSSTCRFYSELLRLSARARDLLRPGLLDGGARLAAALSASRICATARSTPAIFRLEGGLESQFLRGAAAVFPARAWRCASFWAATRWCGTTTASWSASTTSTRISACRCSGCSIAACVVAAGFVWMRRWLLAGVLPLALLIQFVVPRAGLRALRAAQRDLARAALYPAAHPRHAQRLSAWRSASRKWNSRRNPDARIDVAKHKTLLDNVRLWDWRAFHDTITQIQALRPYYTFPDSDVDRYTIDGQYRQVLLSPRELDIRQLPDARTRWINPHFIYTHGYGLVLAPVSQITPDGLPVLLVENAPPEVKTASLKLTRPEIYYGEVTHEPVFVHTAQKEFNYPSGETTCSPRYEGKGGFPISSLPHAPRRRHSRGRRRTSCSPAISRPTAA